MKRRKLLFPLPILSPSPPTEIQKYRTTIPPRPHPLCPKSTDGLHTPPPTSRPPSSPFTQATLYLLSPLPACSRTTDKLFGTISHLTTNPLPHLRVRRLYHRLPHTQMCRYLSRRKNRMVKPRWICLTLTNLRARTNSRAYLSMGHRLNASHTNEGTPHKLICINECSSRTSNHTYSTTTAVTFLSLVVPALTDCASCRPMGNEIIKAHVAGEGKPCVCFRIRTTFRKSL